MEFISAYILHNFSNFNSFSDACTIKRTYFLNDNTYFLIRVK